MSKHNFDPNIRPATQQRQNRQHNVRDDAWIRALLHRAPIATIATAWDAIPFNNITSFWYDEPQHRIIFHSNVMGRIRANVEYNPQVCLSCYEVGNFLPSNAAVEFSVQYRAVLVFGEAQLIEDSEAAKAALYGLIGKYYPKMRAGVEYRPITEAELRQTSIYALHIREWSGKENYKDQADQTDDWTPLSAEILQGGFA